MQLYFYNYGDSHCIDLESIKERIDDDGLKEREVYLAEKSVGEGFFYCKKFGEVGESGEGCGNQCKEYKPRNGKSGRCTYSGHAYNYGEKTLIKI